jgi:outer membrane lipoprotein-sorting protein
MRAKLDRFRENLKMHPYVGELKNRANGKARRGLLGALSWTTLRRVAMAVPVVLVIVLLAWLIPGNGDSGPAFADVLEYIRSARVVAFTITTEVDGIVTATMEALADESGRIRQTMPDGSYHIIDRREGKTVVIQPDLRKATVIDLGDQGALPAHSDIIEEFRSLREGSEEPLGERDIDGVKTVGFRISWGGTMLMDLWADSESGLPVLMEATVPSLSGTKIVMSEFDFDQVVSEETFSLEIPEGYSREESPQFDLSDPTEKDLFEGLRLMTEMSGGAFPDELSLEAIVRSVQEHEQTERPEPFPADSTLKLMRGHLFLEELGEGADVHYVGKGVRRDGPRKPVLWFKPEGSETYRVIYSDLTTGDAVSRNIE